MVMFAELWDTFNTNTRFYVVLIGYVYLKCSAAGLVQQQRICKASYMKAAENLSNVINLEKLIPMFRIL